jgi:hypothetical protein
MTLVFSTRSVGAVCQESDGGGLEVYRRSLS